MNLIALGNEENKIKKLIDIFLKIYYIQSRSQTAAHLVASRQTGTATSILKTILAAAGKDIRTKADNVSFMLN